ncbi:hypothetical protein [Occallatibacter riparius]|uniref:Uncharacterized protein n=1 Tax=Occallatibacter riparius TaxID=1002689 RepID=A0A9J7BTE7_9BACT|nr:hypothetical protein [Occallatibacter riparius]UWZ86171.1 hypothetical protein MOP44_09540 [Occallatibacter riparius]
MAIYKRCSKGVCDETKPNPSLIPGKPGKPANMVYQCVSNATAPCPPTGASCQCFIVVSHHNSGITDDEVKDEEYFPAAPDPTAKSPYKGMLTQADVNKNYKQIGRNPNGGEKQEYWVIGCRCLQTDSSGDPLTALRVQITVPGEAYASVLRKLEKKYGAANVSLIPPPPDPPAKSGRASRKPQRATATKKSPGRAGKRAKKTRR